MSNRAVIYARNALCRDDGIGCTIPVQVEHCRNWASRLHQSVVFEIEDDGVSGATLNRPGLHRLQAMVKQNEIDTVLVHSAERLSRNPSDLFALVDEWRRHGVTLIICE